MPKREDDVKSLLQDILIVQLAQAGVKQHDIRRIAGVGLEKVSRIFRFIRGRKADDK